MKHRLLIILCALSLLAQEASAQVWVKKEKEPAKYKTNKSVKCRIALSFHARSASFPSMMLSAASNALQAIFLGFLA